MTTEPTNGSQGTESQKPYEILVQMDRATLRVTLNQNVKDIDVMISMLSTALRYLDVQYRIAAGIKAQQEAKQVQEQFETARRLVEGIPR